MKALVRARMVVVDEELTEHGFKTPAAEDEKVIERLSAAAPIQRSQMSSSGGSDRAGLWVDPTELV
jgi:hypothetical protein